MLDETIVTEIPPLYCCYGRIGEQVRVPILGSRAKRILHGAVNIYSGGAALLVTKEWNQVTHREFLSVVRAHWRGWDIVLFEDRAGQHTAPDSLFWADCLGIEIRLLPKATPELNAMDHSVLKPRPSAVRPWKALPVRREKVRSSPGKAPWGRRKSVCKSSRV
jgi:DDE superfamily endonuclease